MWREIQPFFRTAGVTCVFGGLFGGSLFLGLKRRPHEELQVKMALDTALGMLYLHAWQPPIVRARHAARAS